MEQQRPRRRCSLVRVLIGVVVFALVVFVATHGMLQSLHAAQEELGHLERIGFDWGVMDEHWEAMFDEFVALRIRSGSGAAALAGDVPKALRDWAELMQRLYHAGELPDAARSRLSVLDFDWGSADHWAESEARALTSVVESREAAAWERRLLELIAYHDVTGDCAVPRQFKHFPGLGSWCVRQRYLFQAGRLPEDRVRLLGELGFSFELLKPATGGAAADVV